MAPYFKGTITICAVFAMGLAATSDKAFAAIPDDATAKCVADVLLASPKAVSVKIKPDYLPAPPNFFPTQVTHAKKVLEYAFRDGDGVIQISTITIGAWDDDQYILGVDPFDPHRKQMVRRMDTHNGNTAVFSVELLPNNPLYGVTGLDTCKAIYREGLPVS